jgi:hypothetical protein
LHGFSCAISAAIGYETRMPQKPMVRKKKKVRDTKRLAKWREKQEAKATPAERNGDAPKNAPKK